MLPSLVLSGAPTRSCWQWRVVQLWPGDIFNCVSCFWVKKHAAFKWKDAISGFPVSPGSAEALVRCGGKIKYILIAYFLGNIYAKNCRNRTVYVKIIAICKGGTFFDTQCRWLYCVECPQYSTRLEALGCLCHCLSGRVQRLLECWQLTCQFSTWQSPAWSSSDRRNYEFRERPTDAGVDWKQTILYTIASCRYLPPESICSECRQCSGDTRAKRLNFKRL